METKLINDQLRNRTAKVETIKYFNRRKIEVEMHHKLCLTAMIQNEGKRNKSRKHLHLKSIVYCKTFTFARTELRREFHTKMSETRK